MDNLKDLEAMYVAVREFRTISKKNREILLNMLSKEHDILGDTVDNPYYGVRAWYLAGGKRDKIDAIRQLRAISGNDADGNCKLGLEEAKDLVESW